jgi:hypothetical protein
MRSRIRFGLDFVLGSELEIRSSSSIPPSVLGFLVLGERSKRSMSRWSLGHAQVGTCAGQRRQRHGAALVWAAAHRPGVRWHNWVAGLGAGL